LAKKRKLGTTMGNWRWPKSDWDKRKDESKL